MTPIQYKQTLARLGLTPASKAAAEALGISVRTSQRYANGTTPVPLSIQIRLGRHDNEVNRALHKLVNQGWG